MERFDPTSQRSYYVNQAQGKKTWKKSEAVAADANSAEESSAAPAAGAVSSDGLGPGWTERMDRASGRIWFSNALTGAKTWNRSEAEAAVAVASTSGAPAGTSSEEVAGAAAEEAIEAAAGAPADVCEDEDPASSDAALVAAAAAVVASASTSANAPVAAAASDGLGPGWVERFDPTSGRFFFVHEVSGERTWKREETLAASPKSSGKEERIIAGHASERVPTLDAINAAAAASAADPRPPSSFAEKTGVVAIDSPDAAATAASAPSAPAPPSLRPLSPNDSSPAQQTATSLPLHAEQVPTPPPPLADAEAVDAEDMSRVQTPPPPRIVTPPPPAETPPLQNQGSEEECDEQAIVAASGGSLGSAVGAAVAADAGADKLWSRHWDEGKGAYYYANNGTEECAWDDLSAKSAANTTSVAQLLTAGGDDAIAAAVAGSASFEVKADQLSVSSVTETGAGGTLAQEALADAAAPTPVTINRSPAPLTTSAVHAAVRMARTKRRNYRASVHVPKHVACEGYLQKRSKQGRWQKRYFQLVGHYLKYYKDEHKLNDANLRAATDVLLTHVDHTNGSNKFEVRLPEGKPMVLQAPSALEAMKWVQTILSTQEHEESPAPGSQRQVEREDVEKLGSGDYNSDMTVLDAATAMLEEHTASFDMQVHEELDVEQAKGRQIYAVIDNTAQQQSQQQEYDGELKMEEQASDPAPEDQEETISEETIVQKDTEQAVLSPEVAVDVELKPVQLISAWRTHGKLLKKDSCADDDGRCSWRTRWFELKMCSGMLMFYSIERGGHTIAAGTERGAINLAGADVVVSANAKHAHYFQIITPTNLHGETCRRVFQFRAANEVDLEEWTAAVRHTASQSAGEPSWTPSPPPYYLRRDSQQQLHEREQDAEALDSAVEHLAVCAAADEVCLSVASANSVTWVRAGEWAVTANSLKCLEHASLQVQKGAVLVAVNHRRVLLLPYREKMELLSSLCEEPLVLSFVPALSVSDASSHFSASESLLAQRAAKIFGEQMNAGSCAAFEAMAGAGGMGSPQKLATDARDFHHAVQLQQAAVAPANTEVWAQGAESCIAAVEEEVSAKLRKFNQRMASLRAANVRSGGVPLLSFSSSLAERFAASALRTRLATLAQIQESLASFGLDENLDRLPSQIETRKLRAALAAANLRNHEMKRAVLGLQWAISRDLSGGSQSLIGSQSGVLSAIAVSRWTVTVDKDGHPATGPGNAVGPSTDQRAQKIGRLLGIFQHEPRFLCALGAQLSPQECPRFAHLLTHGIFDRISTHEGLALQTIQCAVEQTVPQDSAGPRGAELFRAQLLASFARRDECRCFIFKILVAWTKSSWRVPEVTSIRDQEHLLASAVHALTALLVATPLAEFPSGLVAVCGMLERSTCGFSALDFLVQNVLLSAIASEESFAALEALPLSRVQFEPFAELLLCTLLPDLNLRNSAKLHQRVMLSTTVCDFRAFGSQFRKFCRAAPAPRADQRPLETESLVAVSRYDVYMFHVLLSQNVAAVQAASGSLPQEVHKLLADLETPRALSHKEADNPIVILEVVGSGAHDPALQPGAKARELLHRATATLSEAFTCSANAEEKVSFEACVALLPISISICSCVLNPPSSCAMRRPRR